MPSWLRWCALGGLVLYGLGSLVVGSVLLQWHNLAAGVCVSALTAVLWLGTRLPKAPSLTRGTSGPVWSSKPAIKGPNAPLGATNDPLNGFPDFDGRVLARLEVGRVEYGDKSFSRPPTELADEIEEELLDIPGWSYVLWVQLRRLRAKLVRLEQLADREDE